MKSRKISKEMTELIEGMLNKSVEKRFTVDQILAHPIFKTV